MAVAGTEILLIQNDREVILSHHKVMINNNKIHKKNIEVVHLNIKDKSVRYNRLKKLNQTLPVLITQKIQSYN